MRDAARDGVGEDGGREGEERVGVEALHDGWLCVGNERLDQVVFLFVLSFFFSFPVP